MSIPYIDFLKEEGIEHGTKAGYVWGCRCEDCRKRKIRNRSHPRHLVTGRNGKPYHPNAPHGTSNGYKNYRCRCDPCTEAGLKYERERSRRRSQK